MNGVVAYAKGNDDESKDESDYLIAAGGSLSFKMLLGLPSSTVTFGHPKHRAHTAPCFTNSVGDHRSCFSQDL
jgi:hypothetical protein